MTVELTEEEVQLVLLVLERATLSGIKTVRIAADLATKLTAEAPAEPVTADLPPAAEPALTFAPSRKRRPTG